MYNKKCGFCGHRFIFNTTKVEKYLFELVSDLTEKGYKNFYIGSHGDFDRLALSVCRKIRSENNIEINVYLLE